MSCYFRHMKDILEQAGNTVTPQNKSQVDQLLHQMAGVTYKDCPAAWKKLKQDVMTDEQKRRELVRKLKSAFS